MEYWRPMKITNLSAEDLKDMRFVFKMKVYAVVSVTGDPFINPKEECRTPVDNEGETNPSWDTHLNFILHDPSLQSNCIQLLFRFHCDRPLGDGYLGEARAPVKDLFDKANNYNASQRACYQVTRNSGKKKGAVKFSYTFGDIFASVGAPPTSQPVLLQAQSSPSRALLRPPSPLRPQIQYQQQVVQVSEAQALQYPSKDIYMDGSASEPLYGAYNNNLAGNDRQWSPTHGMCNAHNRVIRPSSPVKPARNNTRQSPINDSHTHGGTTSGQYWLPYEPNQARAYRVKPFYSTSEEQKTGQ